MLLERLPISANTYGQDGYHGGVLVTVWAEIEDSQIHQSACYSPTKSCYSHHLASNALTVPN